MSRSWNMKPWRPMKWPIRSASMWPGLFRTGIRSKSGTEALPNAILANFNDKKNLGVHSELLTDGMVELMKKGVINNSQKTLNRGKTVATFCMGHQSTYEYHPRQPEL